MLTIISAVVMTMVVLTTKKINDQQNRLMIRSSNWNIFENNTNNNYNGKVLIDVNMIKVIRIVITINSNNQEYIHLRNKNINTYDRNKDHTNHDNNPSNNTTTNTENSNGNSDKYS